MTMISVKVFGGIKPISNPRLLGNNEAQTAKNVWLVSGALSPLRGLTTLKATALTVPATIYRYGDSPTETEHWLEFNDDTDVMRSPVANDDYDRLYWTSATKPRYAPNSMILGPGLMPAASYELGIPKPTVPVTYGSYSTVPVYTPVTLR